MSQKAAVRKPLEFSQWLLVSPSRRARRESNRLTSARAAARQPQSPTKQQAKRGSIRLLSALLGQDIVPDAKALKHNRRRGIPEGGSLSPRSFRRRILLHRKALGLDSKDCRLSPSSGVKVKGIKQLRRRPQSAGRMRQRTQIRRGSFSSRVQRRFQFARGKASTSKALSDIENVDQDTDGRITDDGLDFGDIINIMPLDNQSFVDRSKYGQQEARRKTITRRSAKGRLSSRSRQRPRTAHVSRRQIGRIPGSQYVRQRVSTSTGKAENMASANTMMKNISKWQQMQWQNKSSKYIDPLGQYMQDSRHLKSRASSKIWQTSGSRSLQQDNSPGTRVARVEEARNSRQMRCRPPGLALALQSSYDFTDYSTRFATPAKLVSARLGVVQGVEISVQEIPPQSHEGKTHNGGLSLVGKHGAIVGVNAERRSKGPDSLPLSPLVTEEFGGWDQPASPMGRNPTSEINDIVPSFQEMQSNTKHFQSALKGNRGRQSRSRSKRRRRKRPKSAAPRSRLFST